MTQEEFVEKCKLLLAEAAGADFKGTDVMVAVANETHGHNSPTGQLYRAAPIREHQLRQVGARVEWHAWDYWKGLLFDDDGKHLSSTKMLTGILCLLNEECRGHWRTVQLRVEAAYTRQIARAMPDQRTWPAGFVPSVLPPKNNKTLFTRW